MLPLHKRGTCLCIHSYHLLRIQIGHRICHLLRQIDDKSFPFKCHNWHIIYQIFINSVQKRIFLHHLFFARFLSKKALWNEIGCKVNKNFWHIKIWWNENFFVTLHRLLAKKEKMGTKHYIPDYLTTRQNLTRLVLWTALYAWLFISIYQPFNSRQWVPDMTELEYFLFGTLVVVTAMTIIAISRIGMCYYCKKHSLQDN